MNDYHYVQEDMCLHIVSQDKAKELGMVFYFTGEPCQNGHVAQRYTSGKQCYGCRLEKRAKEAKRKEEKVWNHSNFHKPEEYNFLQIISRDNAIELGMQWYFDGRPCKHGHFSPRYVNGQVCVVCKSLASKTPEALERARERAKQYRKENPERAKKAVKDWNKSARGKRWKEIYFNSDERRERGRLLSRENNRRRLRNDPNYSAVISMRALLGNFLKKVGKDKTGRTHEMLGYSREEFKSYLESMFLEGMRWENRNFHIDHIYPVTRYIKEGVTDPRIINALENLHPMWPEHNLSKGDKTLEEWLDEKGEDSEEYRLYGHMLKRK